MARKANARRAAIYTRLSEDRNVTELGVQRQEEDCRALAQSRGYEVVGVYSDNDISASKYGRRRPEYERLLADAEANTFDVALAYHPKRLLRQPKQLEDLIDIAEKTGTLFEFVAVGFPFDLGTATGRGMARVAIAFGAMESEESAERISRKELSIAENGVKHGGGRRTFGYTRQMKIVPSEAALVREIASDLLTGGTFYGAAQRLNGLGVMTVSGRTWRTRDIRRMMLGPAIAGIRVHRPNGQGSTFYPGAWEPIISEDQHKLLCLRFPKAEGKGKGERYGARTAILSGLLVCSSCSTTLSHNHDKRWGNRYYICDRSSAGGCGETRVSAPKVEEYVLGQLAWLERSTAPLDEVEEDAVSIDERKVLTELAKLEGAASDLATMVAMGDMDRKTYKLAINTNNVRRQELQRELDRTQPSRPRIEEAKEALLRWQQGLDPMPSDILQIQGQMTKLMQHAMVDPAPPRAPFDPSRVRVTVADGITLASTRTLPTKRPKRKIEAV